ncbi:unnamed protein product [Ceutorhynchus assimilis]|uniref:YqaJ viral recombinase domain-containing protein n=1 Tax=Ceutorhynchus assimilis TaxID=467358 RepID=A0A9N9MI28_9CUCU|nr:unnamed protein product [Ceutorhynchus assimilis]
MRPELNHLSLRIEECWRLEEATRNQASSQLWRKERHKRFTASNFGELSKRRKTPDDRFLSRIFKPKNIDHVPGIKHGKTNENVAREIYQKAEPSVRVFPSGLVVHPAANFLGASADGHLVDNMEVGQENGVLEIKCPLWESLSKGLFIYLAIF